jgi:hypothetical protein
MGVRLAVASVLVVTVVAFSLALANANESPATVVVEEEIPAELRESIVAQVASRYGPVTRVYREAWTTLGEWSSLEPGRTESLQGGEWSDGDKVYAVFMVGEFAVRGMMTTRGQFIGHYVAGRVVADASGNILSVSLWNEVKIPEAAFSSSLDDR